MLLVATGLVFVLLVAFSVPIVFALGTAAVTGLLNEVTIDSSISPIQNSGSEDQRTLEVDWSMRLVERNDVEQVSQREATVKLRLERQHGKWKVTAWEPADLFRPLSARVNLAH